MKLKNSRLLSSFQASHIMAASRGRGFEDHVSLLPSRRCFAFVRHTSIPDAEPFINYHWLYILFNVNSQVIRPRMSLRSYAILAELAQCRVTYSMANYAPLVRLMC